MVAVTKLHIHGILADLAWESAGQRDHSVEMTGHTNPRHVRRFAFIFIAENTDKSIQNHPVGSK